MASDAIFPQAYLIFISLYCEIIDLIKSIILSSRFFKSIALDREEGNRDVMHYSEFINDVQACASSIGVRRDDKLNPIVTKRALLAT